MNKLLTATIAATLVATTASATIVEQPETPRHNEGTDNTAGIVLGIGAIILLGILARNREPAPQNAPRPEVRPEGCLTKYGETTFSCSF